MHPFTSYVLRKYYQATGWNEDNLYTNFTRSSNAILDFNIPRGLQLSISKSPSPLFKTTYSMNALPSLNGSIGYIFTSCDLDVKSSRDVRLKDVVDRFKVFDQPRRPEEKEEVWLAGERVDTRDYLLYGRYYIPTGRLDALYSSRLSPTLQAMVAVINDPRSSSQPSPAQKGPQTLPVPASNLLVSLQHDVGRWCTEYSWSANDGMWGVRVLHNFGKLASSPPSAAGEDHAEKQPLPNANGGDRPHSKVKRVDEEEAMEGGLKGRISAGAEFYISAKEKSAGVSTGIRFTTLPDATPPSFALPPPTSSPLSLASAAPFPAQPPTTITAILNPMLGHISGAYAARVSPDLSLCSRFDFNIYSYESEWTMGAEWWLRRRRTSAVVALQEGLPLPITAVPNEETEVNGVVKARLSTNNDVSLLWEGRLWNILISLGVVSDLASRSKPIRAIGLEVAYFSSE